MVAAVFDTNILIDHLNGVEQAREETRRFARKQISIVTWIEVMVGVPDDAESGTREFLRQFEVIGVDEPIAERAVQKRRAYRIKVPDALIWATAEVRASVLVTRNSKDFPAGDPGVRIPYKLG